MLVVRFPYAYDGDLVSDETGLECLDESLALQSEAEATDINYLVKQFGVTGALPILDRELTYIDFDEIFDYMSAQNALIAADRAFYDLPADVRTRFGNNPAEFVLFCSDEANLEEAVKLGLAIKRPVVEEAKPVKVEVVGKPAP